MIDLVASTGVCSKCRDRKSLIDFYPSKVSASGRMPMCKPCAKSDARTRHLHQTSMDRSSQMPTFDLTQPLTYQAAHQRIHRWRGRASIHQCACGAQARSWAYRHDSPHEQIGTTWRRGVEVEARFSPNPMDYDPMCTSCHTTFDRSRDERDRRDAAVHARLHP